MTIESKSFTVGVVGGTRFPGNVRTFLTNVRRLLDDHPTEFQWELVIRRDAVDAFEGFSIVDPGIEETGRAVETFRTLTRAVTRYAEHSRPDVLFQVTKFPLHGCAVAVAGSRTNTPAVTRLAGDNFREYELADGYVDRFRTFGLNNVIGQVPLRLADAVIVLGPYGRAEIKKRKGSQTIYEIPQPVDRELFSPPDDRENIRDELGIPRDRQVLLTIGRLSYRKGIDNVITVGQKLSDNEFPRWIVIGDGPFRTKLNRIPGVDPIGRVPHDEIVKYYQAADLLVHPSRIEGLPNVLLEAAACGLPSVARDVGECATVSSAVYDDPNELFKLVGRSFEPASLGPRFESEYLRDAYASALIDAATEEPS